MSLGSSSGRNGIFPDDKGNLGYNWNPWYWPAILGYNGYLISDVGGLWVPDCIGRNASVVHSMDVVSQGSINEFAVSMGANFNNVVYVGATIGIRSVYKKVGMTYQEEYGYFDANGHATPAVDKNGTPLNAQLDYMSLYQESKIDAAAWISNWVSSCAPWPACAWVWRSTLRPTTGSTAATARTSNRT